MTETIDRLAKYRRPGQTPAKAPTDAPKAAGGKTPIPLKPYEAYRLSKETQVHLDIRPKAPEPTDCPLNSMLLYIEAEWRRGRWIILTFGTSAGNTMVVKISGKNLQELFQSIKARKVEWLAEFDPMLNLPVEDDATPFIQTIEIVKKKPEQPPPMNQRH